MNAQEQLDYHRIAFAIVFIKDNFRKQPTLKELAAKVNMSPFHFQRVFTEWAGTSPKKFLQYVSLKYAKTKLAEDNSLFATAFDTGFSATSRLHDLFVKIEGMSPAVYKSGGKDLKMLYSFSESQLGNLIIASTQKGICHLSFFAGKKEVALQALKLEYPNALLEEQTDDIQKKVLKIFNSEHRGIDEIKLHLKGPHFQLKVWEALLKIPFVTHLTYNSITNLINNTAPDTADNMIENATLILAPNFSEPNN